MVTVTIEGKTYEIVERPEDRVVVVQDVIKGLGK